MDFFFLKTDSIGYIFKMATTQKKLLVSSDVEKAGNFYLQHM